MSKYSKPASLTSITPFNVSLRSATEETMISALGRPKLPLTTHDQPDRASELVKHNLVKGRNVTKHIRVTGLKPAVDSLEAILKSVGAAEPGLIDVLGTVGMLNVRLRKPTHGHSNKISNHAWGTAIDFNIDGQPAPGDTGHTIPLGIAILVPYFNEAGWYSGISFHDDMHFEASDGLIQRWAEDGTIEYPEEVVAKE